MKNPMPGTSRLGVLVSQGQAVNEGAEPWRTGPEGPDYGVSEICVGGSFRARTSTVSGCEAYQ